MNWKINLWVLTISIVFTSASYTMLIPFLPVYLLELGVSDESVAMWSGAVFSVSFLIGGIMAPIWGKLADKKGKKLMAVRSALALTAVYFIGGIVTNEYELFGMRVLQGFANGFLPASMAIVSSSVPKERLGVSIGIMQTGQIIGCVMGPLIGGTLSHFVGMRASFFLAGIFLAIVSVGVVFLVKEPARVVDEHAGSSIFQDIKRAAKNNILVEMMAMTCFLQIGILILQPVVSLYVGELQGSMENVAFIAGLIFSAGGVAGAIVTPLWGRYGQKYGYFKAMVLAFAGAGIFNILQSLPDGVWGFAVMQFVVGLFIVGVSPSISATFASCTDASFRGRVFGLATTAHQTGSMLGPLIGGVISSMLGIKYVFVFTGCMLLVLSWYLYRRHWQAK